MSGTSISFGSETTFDTNGYCSYFGAAYDANSQKVVAAYLNSGDTQGYAVVGTVSGTSISFGSRVLFNAGRQENIQGVVYDANAQKIVIAYRDGANSNYGTAIVGTVSGTSISFGSKVVFNAAGTEVPCATYDSSINKVVIAYKDQDGTNYGKAIAGTVSGTSISFDPEETFAASDASKIAIAFDANAQASAISYRNASNSNYGTGVVFKVGSTNLTAENYIGTASSPAADGDGVVVNTQGTVDDNQTGLTAGQSYYVQPDGTLSTTAGDPSVFAGTAVSSTKLIVKG